MSTCLYPYGRYIYAFAYDVTLTVILPLVANQIQ